MEGGVGAGAKRSEGRAGPLAWSNRASGTASEGDVVERGEGTAEIGAPNPSRELSPWEAEASFRGSNYPTMFIPSSPPEPPSSPPPPAIERRYFEVEHPENAAAGTAVSVTCPLLLPPTPL